MGMVGEHEPNLDNNKKHYEEMKKAVMALRW